MLKILEKRKLNFSRIALFHMKTTVSLKCFVKDYTSITLVKYKIADQIYQHLKINEEYHQRKNVKGNVDEQLADVRKQVNKN